MTFNKIGTTFKWVTWLFKNQKQMINPELRCYAHEKRLFREWWWGIPRVHHTIKHRQMSTALKWLCPLISKVALR